MKYGKPDKDGTMTVAIETCGDALKIVKQIRKQIDKANGRIQRYNRHPENL